MKLFHWDAPGPYVVAFSTRLGGVSEGPFTSLNLGRKLGDLPERVDENRRRVCEAVGAEVKRLALNFQLHSARVNRARAGVRGVVGDGLWTEEPRLPLLALTADCMPVALARVNGEGPAVAVLHAGRIGVLEGILEAGVAALGGKVAAAIGPAIGPCCYEVGTDVASAYRSKFGSSAFVGTNLDLPSTGERVLRQAGVVSVTRFDRCTVCEPALFFSYRRDGKPRGGQGVLAYVT